MQGVCPPCVVAAVADADIAFVQIKLNEGGDAFVRIDIRAGFIELLEAYGICFDKGGGESFGIR